MRRQANEIPILRKRKGGEQKKIFDHPLSFKHLPILSEVFGMDLKITLRMLAHRTHLRRLLPYHDMTAI